MTSSPAPATLGDYTIEKEIGRGGMAAVYRAHDHRHNRAVAIKVLDRDVAAAVGATRFLQEITTVAGLTHPNIVPVHDSGEQDGVVYYVMPHIEGETLRQRITREKRIPPAEAVRITSRVAAALDFAHRHGVVHRDIKPENIILFEGEPLILDFGIAKAITAAGAEQVTRTGFVIGTPAYLSPEQASGDSTLDGSSDQYSLACTVYEMVSGSPPFTAASHQGLIAKRFTERPRSLNDIFTDIPLAFADAVTRALSLESSDRYPTVSAFASALGSATTAETGRSIGEHPSVAVLPFTNMSADADNEFFADGITEDIINALTRVRALKVSSRTASFAFKGKNQGVDDIARRLRVDNVLDGSVRRAGNRLRVSVQLVAVATGNTLWSDRFDRELADVFAIQDEIATSIVKALELVLSGDEKAAISRVPTRNVRAYEYYLRGRQLYHQRRAEALAAAEDMYNRAIALDPEYALAYAGLSDAAAVRYGSFGGGQAALDQAEAASRRAVDLDPRLAEAHAARGLVLSYNKRFDEAEREFTDATRLDPTSYDAAYHYARMLAASGQVARAAEMFERAASLRPDDYQALSLAMNMHYGSGSEREALAAGRRAVDAAKRALTINPGDARALSLGADALSRLGDEASGREWLERSLKLDPTNSMIVYNAACFESVAGRTDVALDYLTRAVDLGFSNTSWLKHDPDVAAIRGHARFREQLQRTEAAESFGGG